MRTTKLLIVLLSLHSLVSGAEFKPVPKPKTMITLQQLKEMFSNMRAKTKWNLDGDMLWGYFFTDPDLKKLESIAKHLSETGFHVVSIHPTDDQSTHVLHVERVEHHTPETLDIRNKEFEALAVKFHIETYDGMDVGPVPPKSNK